MFRRRPGFTLIELMIVIALIAIISAFAVPSLLSAKLAAYELSAITTLKALRDVQLIKKEKRLGGSSSYCSTLSELGPDGLNLIDEVVASGTKQGYRFYFGTDTTYSRHFFARGNPLVSGESGDAYFYVSNTSSVRYSFAREAVASDPPAPN